MGLPTFFRWIFERYPKCVTDAVKPDPSENLNRMNPNDEVDNLYIDVNDILHIAFHPEDAQTPSNFVECMESLTAQIEEMVRITRPRQMIYIAFDGVAPRAKLNIQRKRRFEKFQSSTLSKKRLKQLQIYRDESGLEYNEPKEHDWNSNCLSPGTDFMFKASNYVSNWIQEKQLKDSFWTGLHIILSDSSTPGEGEQRSCSTSGGCDGSLGTTRTPGTSLRDGTRTSSRSRSPRTNQISALCGRCSTTAKCSSAQCAPGTDTAETASTRPQNSQSDRSTSSYFLTSTSSGTVLRRILCRFSQRSAWKTL